MTFNEACALARKGAKIARTHWCWCWVESDLAPGGGGLHFCDEDRKYERYTPTKDDRRADDWNDVTKAYA